MAINSKLLNKNIALDYVYDDPVFMLIEVNEKIKFMDGVRTDQIEGYNYSVVDLKNFDKISISVISKKPLITNDTLQNEREQGKQFYVEFVNATVKAYVRYKNKQIEGIYDTYNADDIAFVETK